MPFFPILLSIKWLICNQVTSPSVSSIYCRNSIQMCTEELSSQLLENWCDDIFSRLFTNVLKAFWSEFSRKKSFYIMEIKRSAVIALHLGGKAQKSIVSDLKHHKINKTFVSRTIKRYKKTGGVTDKLRCGRPKSATTKEMVKKVRERIRRNPCQSANKMATDMGVSPGSISRILKKDLGLMPHKQKHEYSADQKNFQLRSIQPAEMENNEANSPTQNDCDCLDEKSRRGQNSKRSQRVMLPNDVRSLKSKQK